jgi:hypothetical protein
MTPRILLAATSRWIATARLATAFVKAGCEVDVVCPRGHPVTKTRTASRVYDYKWLAPLRSIADAIDAVRPDCIIPCDDLATAHLQRLYGRAVRSGDAAARRALLEKSLGEPASVLTATARAKLMRLAHEHGIRVPPTTAVHAIGELEDWIDRNGLPAVLKTDGSYGGRGVQVVYAPEEARRAWKALSTPPSLRRAIKRAIVNGDMTYLRPCMSRTGAIVNVQRFVEDGMRTARWHAGRERCWRASVRAYCTRLERGDQRPSSSSSTIARCRRRSRRLSVG